MTDLTLTQKHARRFMLAHQNLWPPFQLEGKKGVLDHIYRVNAIQYDPLNMVGRNPDLVLQARVADYQPWMLDELLYQDRALLDGWDKCMSIYRVSDWPYFGRLRENARRRYDNDHRPAAEIFPHVRQEFLERGPLSSLDLDLDQRVDWHWGPTRIARAAMESMYSWGELIVHHKVNTRKVYDLAHRHFPEELLAAPDPNSSDEEYQDWYVSRRLGSIGLVWDRATDAWIGMHSVNSRERNGALGRLLAQGRIIEARVEGISRPVYLRSEDQHRLDGISHENGDRPARAVILAPLDNLIWDRRFVEALFDFSYVWEVYKPVADRRYGYYVLPILCGDRFVARFEPVRDKKRAKMVIKNWWWEDGVVQSENMKRELRRCLEQFLCYLGMSDFELSDSVRERAALEWLG